MSVIVGSVSSTDALGFYMTPSALNPYQAPDGSCWVSRGAYEQSVHLKEAQRRIQELEIQLALEKGKKFPVDGISGEFLEHEGRKSVAFWPASVKTWPKRTRIVDGKCDFCGSEWHVLEIDSAEGEYDYACACQSCLNKVFDAFDKAVTG